MYHLERPDELEAGAVQQRENGAVAPARPVGASLAWARRREYLTPLSSRSGLEMVKEPKPAILLNCTEAVQFQDLLSEMRNSSAACFV